MKKTFQQYRHLTDIEKDEIWQKGLIILDTNVLLDFYCYGKEALDDYYRTLKKAKRLKQLWMPYQVGIEFFENRLGVIDRQFGQYDNLLKYFSGTRDQIANLKNVSPTHAHLDFEKIASRYETAVSTLKKDIENLRDKHPDYLGEDSVLQELEKIYSDTLIGEEYTADQLEVIVKEGEERYLRKIPPGYKDQSKKESDDKPNRNRKYGDLIIWKQILDKASQDKRPIILVTNDTKEDWVHSTKDGRKLGPQPALRKEILEVSHVDFLLYSADEFLDEAHKRFGLSIKSGSVSEVKRYRVLSSTPMLDHGYHYENMMRPDPYWRELHRYAHRARSLANEAVRLANTGIDLPRRLIDTLDEVRSSCNVLHSLTSTFSTRDLQSLKDFADRTLFLIRRVNNIVSDRITIEWQSIVREIAYLVDRILELLDDPKVGFDHSD